MANVNIRRKSGFILRSGVMRRETVWGFLNTAVTTIAAASTAVLIGTLNAAALALRPFTIVRVRGELHGQSDQIGADELWGGSLGWAVVSDQASAIGVTAVPTPEADRGSDLFFVYESMYGNLAFASAVGFRETGFNRSYDSKAMRKVNGDSDIAVVLESSSSSSSFQAIHSARFLVKLH